MCEFVPSYVAKNTVKKIPFVGVSATQAASCYVDRSDKESKHKTFEQIAKRQEDCENGLYPPLIINAEGGTTNGRHLIHFKKGGFFALRSVQPVIVEYNTEGMEMENCMMPIHGHIVLSAVTSTVKKITVVKLPTFKPNEYFFNKFARQGEEKWETYARVIREIMSDNSHLQLSDKTIEDKFEYRKQLFPKKRATD